LTLAVVHGIHSSLPQSRRTVSHASECVRVRGSQAYPERHTQEETLAWSLAVRSLVATSLTI
jgi:hypothetical protein